MSHLSYISMRITNSLNKIIKSPKKIVDLKSNLCVRLDNLSFSLKIK